MEAQFFWDLFRIVIEKKNIFVIVGLWIKNVHSFFVDWEPVFAFRLILRFGPNQSL